jgi:hypothetical protein
MGTSAGVIDFFVHPPLALLRRSTTSPVNIPNPLSGSGSLDVTTGFPPRSAFGFRWAINLAPTEAGRSSRTINVFEQPWLAFSLHYHLADGSDFIADEVQTGLAEGFWLWAIALPSTLQYDILPGFSAHFDWLVGI